MIMDIPSVFLLIFSMLNRPPFVLFPKF
jgi:hypothetical protein